MHFLICLFTKLQKWINGEKLTSHNWLRAGLGIAVLLQLSKLDQAFKDNNSTWKKSDQPTARAFQSLSTFKGRRRDCQQSNVSYPVFIVGVYCLLFTFQ